MTITVVKNENREYFEPMVNRNLLQESDLSLGAVDDDYRACGILLGRQEADVFMVTYLYVSENSRHMGMATGMCELLRDICARCGINGICAEVSQDDDSGVLGFFRGTGYQQYSEESPIYRFRLEDINAKLLEKSITLPEAKVECLDNILDREFNIIRSERNQKRAYSYNEIIPNIGARGDYDLTVSQVLVKKGTPDGCILVSKTGEDYLIDYLYVGGDRSNPLEVMALIAGAFKAAKKVNEKCCVYANAANNSVSGILERITDNKIEKCGSSILLYQYV